MFNLFIKQWAPAAACAAILSGSMASAQGEFPTGTDTLFIGHSYFIRVAQAFNEIAEAGNFPDHTYQEEFRGGDQGSPEALYLHQPSRDRIEDILDTREIDLFAMTVHHEQSEGTYYYEEWINYALAQNPDTKILLAAPWETNGPLKELNEFREGNTAFADDFHLLVQELREIYAGRTEIYYIGYANVMAELWEQFDAGELEAVTYFDAQTQCEIVANENDDPDPAETCRERSNREPYADDSLFIDHFGHSGPVGYHTAAMVWFYFLYEDIDYVQHINPDYGILDVLDAGKPVVSENRRRFSPFDF